MNAIEKQVYNRLKYHPKIKNMIVYLYQLIFSIMPRKNIVTNFKIYERQNFFFGFHDKSPWSFDNKYLLAHRFDCSNRLPAKTDFIQVGYFKGNGWDEFVMIDETNAWNWQTGSMLQWVGNSHDFIFNIYENKIHRSKICNKPALSSPIKLPVSALMI